MGNLNELLFQLLGGTAVVEAGGAVWFENGVAP